MYKEYFGFIEPPFSIVPNARYLFLSSRHREAMNHLKAGLGEGGGFAMLTGEVGTGKTTVSKAMLASLEENIDAGVILNPTFSETDLLEAICDEFSIAYPEQASLKQLNQVISKYLHANFAGGKQTLLLIDEAQHLSAQVLEQLRLLTNLETDSQKLLKVLLVGQPELQAKLQTAELRQLAQRITGRYHLLPLTLDEIALYIAFRLRMAGVDKPLFNKKAIRIIADKTGGVPRLINLVCDKALQYACYNGEKEVTGSIAGKACDDVLAFQAPVLTKNNTAKPGSYLTPVAIACLSAFAVASGIYFYSQRQEVTQPDSEPVVVIPAVKEAETVVVIEPEVTVDTVTDDIVDNNEDVFYRFVENSQSEIDATRLLYSLWGVEVSVFDAECKSASTEPFYCEVNNGLLKDIVRLNRPVVLTLTVDGALSYPVLYGIYNEYAELLNDQQRIRIPLSWLESNWSGEYKSLWYSAIDRTLRLGYQGSDVLVLDSLLAKAMSGHPLNTMRYSDALRERVELFQSWQKVVADGIAGKQTYRLLDYIANDEAPVLITDSSDIAESQQQVKTLSYPAIGDLQQIATFRNKRKEVPKKDIKGTSDEIKVIPVVTDADAKNASGDTLKLDTLDLSELSPELAERVQSAFEEDTAVVGKDAFAEADENTIVPDKLIDEQSKYKGVLPALDLQTHMYASDAKRRWVKINGKELSEGEWLGDNIQLISISPRNIVIQFEHQQIEIPALYEWQG